MTASGAPNEAFDVIVVGAGLAGCAAAVAAAELGATVYLLEKTAQPGGSTVQAGGGLLFAGTELQKLEGIDDTPSALGEAIRAAGHGRNDPDLVSVYVDRQQATYEWLRDLGAEFALAPANADITVPRLHVTRPAALVGLLHERLVASPSVTYHHDVALRRLERDERGRVARVHADGQSGSITLTAERGVVLATGGFSRSPALLQTFAPEWSQAQKLGGSGNTGDGLRAAMALGAGLADMGYLDATFGASANDHPALPANGSKAPRLLFAHAAGAIIVNGSGERFTDESQNYKALGRLVAQHSDGLAYQIFDQTVMDRSRPSPTPRNFLGALDDGLVVSAPTVTELAALVGFDPTALADTVARYNGAVATGVDTEFGRPVGEYAVTVGPLDRAPFYAFPCRAGLTATYCGVTVDSQLRVVDVFGDPIEGLWAAGELVGGFHGAGYLTGTALGKAAVFGREAGRHAALHEANQP